jgi:hypothetical protein
VDLYRLHHAMEFWSWPASAGKLAALADIRTDLEKIIRVRDRIIGVM